MADKTYNGWTNYETWNVNLWIDNDQGSQEYWQERAQTAYDDSEADAHNTREENATSVLREQLKDHFENERDELLDAAKMSSSMWADLLGAALSECNFQEIAEHMIEEVDKEEAPSESPQS